MLLAGMPFTKLLSTLSNFGSSLLKEIRLHHGCGLFFVLWQCREKMLPVKELVSTFSVGMQYYIENAVTMKII